MCAFFNEKKREKVSDNFWLTKLTLKVRILQFLTTRNLKVIDVKKMERNLPIGICLDYIRRLSWIITTMVTLVVVCVLWNGELRRAKLSLLSVNSHILRFTLEIPISTIPATVQWTLVFNSVKNSFDSEKHFRFFIIDSVSNQDLPHEGWLTHWSCGLSLLYSRAIFLLSE